MNQAPDPLENDEYNSEVTSILRSDAVLFEPHVNDGLFVSPSQMLKRHLKNFDNSIPFLSIPNISAVSQLGDSLRNVRLDSVQHHPQYPNQALIVHENSRLDARLLSLLKEIQKSNHQSLFKFRDLTSLQVSQFTKNSDYIDPLIRAGQIIALPSFAQPEPFFWDTYSASQLQIYGGILSDFRELNKQILQLQKLEFRNYNSQLDQRLQFDDDKITSFAMKVSLQKLDHGESDLAKTAWKYN